MYKLFYLYTTSKYCGLYISQFLWAKCVQQLQLTRVQSMRQWVVEPGNHCICVRVCLPGASWCISVDARYICIKQLKESHLFFSLPPAECLCAQEQLGLWCVGCLSFPSLPVPLPPTEPAVMDDRQVASLLTACHTESREAVATTSQYQYHWN